MNRTLIAIDGGATKTALTVCDHDGFELFSTTSSGSNYQAIGHKQVEQVITNLLSDAATHLHDWHIDVAVFAIAGIDTAQDVQILRSIIEQSIAASPLKIENYVVENDVEATLKGLTKNEPGALLISGTGAIAYGYLNDTLIRVGGWGHRVGDEGSGYWIGQKIAQAIFQAYDGRAEQTLLTDLVLQQKGLQSTAQLYNLMYNDSYTNAQLASLSSNLQTACDLKDAVALRIASDAAAQLYSLASVILQQNRIGSKPFPLFLNGGVLKNNACIYDLLVKRLKADLPNLDITLCSEQPINYLIERAKLLFSNNKTWT